MDSINQIITSIMNLQLMMNNCIREILCGKYLIFFRKLFAEHQNFILTKEKKSENNKYNLIPVNLTGIRIDFSVCFVQS